MCSAQRIGMTKLHLGANTEPSCAGRELICVYLFSGYFVGFWRVLYSWISLCIPKLGKQMRNMKKGRTVSQP